MHSLESLILICPRLQPVIKKEPTASNLDPAADTSKARQTSGSRSLPVRRTTRGDDDDYRPNNRVALPATSSSARRPRGRKDEAKQESGQAPATEPTAPAESIFQAVVADSHAPAKQAEPLAPSGASVSAKPRRARRQARRAPSPEPLISHNGDNMNEEVASLDSEEPDTPLALSLPRLPSGHRPVDHAKKEPQSRGVASTPSLPNSKASVLPAPSPVKTGGTTPSLKIRLPGLASLHRAPLSTAPKPIAPADSRELPSVSAAPSRSRASRSSRSNAPRERRSSRRDRTSTSVSLHETPASNDAEH